MAVAGSVLLGLAIAFIVLVTMIIVYDVLVAVFHLPTISLRIQYFIRDNPALSILEGAVLGFLVGLFLHFQIETWNYYWVEIASTIPGVVLGIIIWRLRKKGQLV